MGAKLIISLVAVLLVPACGLWSSSRSGPGQATAPLGSFSTSGPTFGQQTLRPVSCAVGQRQVFLGFDLIDEHADVVTRLVVDPVSGPVVRVFKASAPFDTTIVFRRSECGVFHFSLDSTGWEINDLDQLEVSLDLDCRLPSGDGIVGKAVDPGCL